MKTNNAQLIETFNQRFPVGSKCRWRSALSQPYTEVTIKHAAYDSHGQAVAFFQERSGFCSIDPRFVDYNSEPNGVVEKTTGLFGSRGILE